MFYWFKKKKFYLSFKGKLFLIKISVGENLEKKNKLCKFLKNEKKYIMEERNSCLCC